MVARLEERLTSISAQPALAKVGQARILQLWSLLPAYCINPTDVVETLPLLESRLIHVTATGFLFPELLYVICRALRNLAGSRANGETVMRMWSADERVVWGQLAQNMMPVLFRVVGAGLARRAIQPVLDTLAVLSSFASSTFIGALFKKVLQVLLESTIAGGNPSDGDGHPQDQAVAMCELAITLIPNLTEPSIDLLYNAIKPMLALDVSAPFQKRCYKILFSICHNFPEFVLKRERLLELVQLLTTSLLTCHVAARQMRLRCLVRIVEGFERENPVHMEAIPSIIGEVILCTKDSNGKAREVAYDLLLILADRCGSTRHFIEIITAALAARTPHMRSAAVLSLTRLVATVGPKDRDLQGLIPELLSTVLVLLHERAREVVKSVIAFVRVAIFVCDEALLAPVVSQIVDGLMKWAGETRNRFRAQIKLIMMKLCRLFGFDYIAELLPADDRTLITYLQKVGSRSQGRKRTEGPSRDAALIGGDDLAGDLSEADAPEDGLHYLHAGEEEGLDCSRGGADSRRMGPARGDVIVQAHTDDGGVVDLLDGSVSALANICTSIELKNPHHVDALGDIEVAADGRIIVPEDVVVVRKSGERSGIPPMANKRGKVKRKRGTELEEPDRYKKIKGKRGAGHEYRSKNGAGGDVRKAGIYEPFAYIPLDGKALATRKYDESCAIHAYADVITTGRAVNKRR
jgi:ribosomal RNA-processing protein 12